MVPLQHLQRRRAVDSDAPSKACLLPARRTPRGGGGGISGNADVPAAEVVEAVTVGVLAGVASPGDDARPVPASAWVRLLQVGR